MRIYVFFLILYISSIQITFGNDVYENKIYEDNIKTALLHPYGFPFATPLLQLSTLDVLALEFDELGEDVSDFKYAIVQCDFEWKPTNESTFDYIDGFAEGYVNDYDYSFNTTVAYVHFKLSIPNEDLKITKSGNYVVVIYRDEINEPVFVRRFMVVESKVEIQAYVALTRNQSLRDKLQEIVFDVDHKGIDISNPFNEIKVSIVQNDRWDNAIIGVRPLHILENRMSFNYHTKIAFPSMKEYREFDVRSLRYRTEHIAAIDVRDTCNIVYVQPDDIRKNMDYLYEGDGDLNGKFLIDVQEGRHSQLESDYVKVNFALPFNINFSNGTFYVVGEFNHYEISEENKMVYNERSKGYETSIFLKQGFYNYIYVFVENDGNGYKDHSFTEGNYYDAENNYAIYVYYRPFGQRYDQLIGFSFINSRLNKF